MGHSANRGAEHTIRNIVYSKLSYFELSVLRSLIFSARTIPKRIPNQISWIPFLATSYLILDWAEKENWRFHRKNPADFENDV